METNDSNNKNDKPKFVNNLPIHVGRLTDITERAIKLGVTKISKEMKPKIDMANAAVMAYQKCAILCQLLDEPMPEDVEDKTTKCINDYEDQMTLELSSKV